MPSHYSTHTGAEVDAAVTKIKGYHSGSFNLGNPASGGSVVGLALPFVPTKVLLTVRVPDASDALLMFACAVDDSLSADGFDFLLSGETDAAGYKLDYLLTL